ncbi:MAG: haloacid dehalogenase type II [Rhodospirillaceae bacterium]|nr:haloacid dehalogenase type II [Rhodospirillaceae bacterium]
MITSVVEVVKRETKVLVFDQYGTVVDMQKGLVDMVTPFLEEKEWEGNPNQFVTWWRRTHFEDSMIDSLIDRGHTTYRQIGHRAVSQVLSRAKIQYTQDEVEWLVSCIERLKPFPDAISNLHSLHEQYNLCILSNGDRDMLDAAKEYIGFDFDITISVQESGAFKPDQRTYAKAEEIINQIFNHIERGNILFVANHAFDCIGAKAWGFKTVFIDRRGRPFGESPHQPDLIVKSFDELTNLLT